MSTPGDTGCWTDLAGVKAWEFVGATDRRPSPEAAYARWTGDCVDAGWRGAPAVEQVPVSGGLDRVTAAPVRALRPAPRFTCAAMDGIAIKAEPGAVAERAASRSHLAPSSFTWVDTGHPMPEDTDTVVVRERVRALPDGSVEITGPAPRGQHVRAVGEDFQVGQEVVPAGRRLRPPDLAAAAATGHVTLAVARQPVAALIPTGNEIQPVGSVPRPDGVIDSNSLMLAARATQVGALPVVDEVQCDDEAAIAAGLRRAAAAADLVLIIAGSGAGRADYAAAVIARAGQLSVQGVAVRPGHPVLLGHVLAGEAAPDEAAPDEAAPGLARGGRPVKAVPVMGVPGYPMAAAVVFDLFAVPLLAALQGVRLAKHAQQVQLACDWTSSPEIEDWIPVTLSSVPADPDAAGPVLATPGRRGAGAISRLISADAWWPIPIGQGKFARGDLIEVQPTPTLL
jgi:putative molybdopterin biosynthesis protein